MRVPRTIGIFPFLGEVVEAIWLLIIVFFEPRTIFVLETVLFASVIFSVTAVQNPTVVLVSHSKPAYVTSNRVSSVDSTFKNTSKFKEESIHT